MLRFCRTITITSHLTRESRRKTLIRRRKILSALGANNKLEDLIDNHLKWSFFMIFLLAIRKHFVKRGQYWTLNIFLSISGFRNPRISESCRCLKERALWINCRHWRSPDDWKRCQNDAKSCWQTFEAKPASFDKWTHLELNFLTWLRKLSPITYQCFKKCHQIYQKSFESGFK